MDLVYRVVGVVGVLGGVLALLVFLGITGDEKGNVALLVIGIVFLAIGIPALLRWIKTL